MRLLRVALMTIAVLWSLVPMTAAAHNHHDQLSGVVAAAVDHAFADHDHRGAHHAYAPASQSPCSHHHDAGKCCGLPCCCPTCFAYSSAESLSARHPLVLARGLAADDRRRDSIDSDRPQEPPIAA